MAADSGGKKFSLFSKGGLLLGGVFGGLTSFGVWPDGFPTGDILAPMQAAGEQFAENGATPEWVPWAVKGVATLFFGIVGFVLTKLKQLWWLLLLLAALWGAGYLLKAKDGEGRPTKSSLPAGAGGQSLVHVECVEGPTGGALDRVAARVTDPLVREETV